MSIYETTKMLKYQAILFTGWFDKRVGTEREITDLGDGLATVTCFELEGEEVATCVELEHKALSVNADLESIGTHEDMSMYLNKDVSIITKSGMVHKGRITEVNSDSVWIEEGYYISICTIHSVRVRSET